MSGIFLTIQNCDRNGYRFNFVKGMRAHMTLIYTGGIVKASYNNSEDYDIKISEYAQSAFSVYHGQKIKMGEVKVNTFFLERENRNRTDVLWYIDPECAKHIHHVRKELFDTSFYDISVDENFYNELHVTLAADISLEKANEFIALHQYHETFIEVIGLTTD